MLAGRLHSQRDGHSAAQLHLRRHREPEEDLQVELHLGLVEQLERMLCRSVYARCHPRRGLRPMLRAALPEQLHLGGLPAQGRLPV